MRRVFSTIRPTLAERFWAKVDKNGPIHPTLGTCCWLWIGGTNERGYGRTRDAEQIMRPAHHVALMLEGVVIASEMLVIHRCDVPPCVRPAHLRIGTQSDNILDMYEKGRSRNSYLDRRIRPRGENSPTAKLTAVAVAEIRLASHSIPVTARRFGISQSQVWRIRNGLSWAGVDTDHVTA